MKIISRYLAVFAIALLVDINSEFVIAAPAEQSSILNNLYLDLTGGGERPTGEDSTAYGSIGANWGIPLTPGSEGVALGVQVGCDIKIRDDDPEFDATFGLFGRNFKSFGDQQAAFALLMDYRHTSFGNDLVALRPVIGTTISAQDAIGLTGVAGLNTSANNIGATRISQEAIDRIEAFWNRDWSARLATEFSVGYQMSHVNEALFGAQLVYGINEHVDIALGGEINTDGDFAAGVTMSYHFGGTGRHATLHNIRGSGTGLYTPFPKRSFPAMMHRTVRRSVGSITGGTTGGPTTPSTPPDTGTGTTDNPGGTTTGDNGGGTGGTTTGDTGGGTGGDSGGTTGGDTGGNTGGDTGGNTGGDTGGNTGGDTGGNTGGDTGGNTGGDTGGDTGGNTGGDNGGGNGGGPQNWRNHSGGGDGTNPGGHGNIYGGNNHGGLKQIQP